MEDNQLTVPPLTDVSNYQTVNNLTVTQRRQEVLTRMFNNEPTDDLAEKYNVAIQTINNDKHTVRSWWRKVAGQSINDLQEQELNHAFQMRSECYNQWTDHNHSDRYMFLVLKWTERIASLYGLDAPTKNIQMNIDYADFAKQSGVSRRDLLLGMIRETIELLKDVPVTSDELAPLRDALDNVQVVTEGQ